MALVKDEWIIRKSSTVTISKANNYIRGKLDDKQEDNSNKDTNDGYIDHFFADLFDSRDGSLYRIYSVGATNDSSVIDGDAQQGDSYFNVVNVQDIISVLTSKNKFIPIEQKDSFLTDDNISGFKIEDEIIQIVNAEQNKKNIDTVIIG